MGDIAKKRKIYDALDLKEVEDLPKSWQFEINGKRWDFEKLANWGDRKQLAYWFSVVIWRLRNQIENKTRVGYWYAFKKFWQFLDTTEESVIKVSDINNNHFLMFRTWLNTQHKINKNNKSLNSELLTFSTKRKTYGYIRQTFKYLTSLNITNENLQLPKALFQNQKINTEKTIPFSQSERARIVTACKMEFEAINAEEVTKYRQIYVPHILTLALRTGFNPQPILDLRINSLKPSLLDGRFEISIKKNRGYSSQKISFKNAENQDELAYVSKRIVPLFKDLIEKTAGLRAKAGKEVATKIFLVPGQSGVVRVLNSEELWVNIQRFRDKYKLLDDAGNPLEINIRRMRPTFAHALLRINGGDLRDLQKRLNHKNIETTMGYLDANQDEFKSSFKFRGIIMQHILSGCSAENLSSEINCSIEEAEQLVIGNNRMLVGVCKNPYNSPFQNNSGEMGPCTKFMACFRCHNQVITKEDSHKVFSFYWFLLGKKKSIPLNAWEKNYEWIIKTIDNDIYPNLGNKDEIEKIKMDAFTNPHPAWPKYDMDSI